MNLKSAKMYAANRYAMPILAVLFTIGLAIPLAAEIQSSGIAEQILSNPTLNRKRLVADHLPLTLSEAEQFWPIYGRFEQELFVLAERRKAIIGKFGENYEAMTAPVAKELIQEYLDFQEDHVKLLKAYLPKFEKILPAKKLVRFYQIEARMRAAVEAEIAEHVPLLQ
jgi:hypothetical protein